MTHTLQLRLRPEQAHEAERLRTLVMRELRLPKTATVQWRIRKKSIDARHRNVLVNLTLDVYVDEPLPEPEYAHITYPNVADKPSAIVVGAGPGGYFAALRLVERGVRPILLERGRCVAERKKDIARIPQEQRIDPESNYSFGEGGAGAFSDGKLYTRSKKRGNVEKILQVFCLHGANDNILYDAHPHIGTDKLPKIIERMRQTLIDAGGEVHFNTLVTGLNVEEQRVVGVRTKDGRTFAGPVILATGHSARDVYRFLYKDGVRIEPKGLAVGVRLEHPQHLIDQLQYHNPEGRGKYLPAAEYAYVTQAKERGVYSFCMCPGGFVVPAATAEGQVVVNGMSPANRGSRWSNSGMVVEVRPEDLDDPKLANFMTEAMADEGFASTHTDYTNKANPLRLMYFQEALERMNWLQGGRTMCAPAQRMHDFVQGKLSYDLPKTSYTAGLISSPLHFWLPKFVSERLQQGFVDFDRKCRGFLTNEAVMIGVESRTSAPVRIPRDKETLVHEELSGFYPCGEGAGYAGGIVSAAIDGERCADALADALLGQGQ